MSSAELSRNKLAFSGCFVLLLFIPPKLHCSILCTNAHMGWNLNTLRNASSHMYSVCTLKSSVEVLLCTATYIWCPTESSMGKGNFRNAWCLWGALLRRVCLVPLLYTCRNPVFPWCQMLRVHLNLKYLAGGAIESIQRELNYLKDMIVTRALVRTQHQSYLKYI